MRDSRLEQSQMYYKNVLAKKITEDVNFVPAYEEAMEKIEAKICLLYTSPSPRDRQKSRMPSSA